MEPLGFWTFLFVLPPVAPAGQPGATNMKPRMGFRGGGRASSGRGEREVGRANCRQERGARTVDIIDNFEKIDYFDQNRNCFWWEGKREGGGKRAGADPFALLVCRPW